MKSKQGVFIFLLLLAGFAALAYGAEKKADRYDPLYQKEPLKASSLKDPFSRILAFPFEIIKWPVDKALLYVENWRLDKKTKWLYEKSIDYGIRPRLDTLDFSGAPAFGADFDFVRIAKLREKYPDLIAQSWINYGPTNYFQASGEIGTQRIGGTGFHTAALLRYENRRNETFYGIGPHTSMGNSTSFIEETTTIGASAGYEFSPTLDLVSRATYEHVNIKNRLHNDKGTIPDIFAGQNIPGVNGDHLLGFSIGLVRDTRDSKGAATQGSYQKLLFKYTEGVSSSPARYLTYQIDAAKYFRLASPRRILVARIFGEFNQTVNRGTVPFYEMTKLGGSGVFPFQGQTQRGFVYDRFYGQSALLLNLEYRYAIWQYREFKLDTAFFLDEGQVSKDFATFQLKSFRTSYGLGFYLSYSKYMLLNFSVAHADEGTQFYIQTKMPF